MHFVLNQYITHLISHTSYNNKLVHALTLVLHLLPKFRLPLLYICFHLSFQCHKVNIHRCNHVFVLRLGQHVLVLCNMLEDATTTYKVVTTNKVFQMIQQSLCVFITHVNCLFRTLSKSCQGSCSASFYGIQLRKPVESFPLHFDHPYWHT